MKSIMYKTSGTCSQFVEMEADENNVVTRAVVVGGCHGNLHGICKLIVGMRLEDVKERLSGIRCGSKPTSCPDQIAKAIEELEKQ
ncbi:MAG: TIGR03905 family TSCPD domain-containing protein [Paludibacteraceae bacterium]|nr:TIGR03905 family TSCPD domain-containing protein [Paludibacteraceae bacterium]